MGDSGDIRSGRLEMAGRDLALLLFGLALLGQGLTPAAALPERSSAGPAITICTGDGPRQIALSGGLAPRPGQNQHDLCGLCCLACPVHAPVCPAGPATHRQPAAHNAWRSVALGRLFLALRHHRPPVRAPPGCLD